MNVVLAVVPASAVVLAGFASCRGLCHHRVLGWIISKQGPG